MRKKDLGDKLILIVQEEYEKLENSSFKTIRKYAKEFDEEMNTNPYFNYRCANAPNAAAICTQVTASVRRSRWGSSASKKKF